MWTTKLHFTKINPTWPSCLMLTIVCSSPVHARQLNVGESETLTPSPVVESWRLPGLSTLTVNGARTLDIDIESGTLIVNGGQTQQISAFDEGKISLTNATVTSAGTATGLFLANSSAVVTGTTISTAGLGLLAARDTATQTGSTLSLQDSVVRGIGGGGVVTSYSLVNLSNTTLEGSGTSSIGLGLAGGSVNASAGSKIIGGLNGVNFRLDRSDEQLGRLILDNSSVEGKAGAAIRAELPGNPLGAFVIQVNNGSTLIGGNGSILEVAGGSAVDLNVDNSSLQGNVIVEQGSIADITLQNSASLTGTVTNVASFKLDNQSVFTGSVEKLPQMTLNDSTWIMTGNNQVNQLAMAGGVIEFAPQSPFYQLDVANLSGNGTLKMATDFGTRQTDFLNVTGRATGDYQVLVTATGSRPASADPIQIIRVADGDAQFALSNGSVDAGAFTYRLFQEGDGWSLRPDTQISISTRSVLAIANTAPTVIDAERTLLNTRMGDRRLTGGSGGVWTRTYGNRYSVQDGYGGGYSQTQQGLVVGADTRLADGDWLAGGMVGYSKSRLDLKQGSSGTVDSYSLGAYMTKLDTQSGVYVDAVAKINRFDNQLNVSMSDGVRARGDYDTYGVSGSIEVGKRFNFNEGFFITPFAQVNAAAVSGNHYSLDNGLDVDNQVTRSLLAKAGAYVGNEIDLGNGQTIQPRIRAAVGHEFIKANEVDVNQSKFNNDTSTTSLELAGGINWALPGGVQIFAEAGSSQSSKITQDYNVSAGFSVAF